MRHVSVVHALEQSRLDVDPETAFTLVGQGLAVLNDVQSHAPLDLVSLIAPSRFQADRLGPDTTSPKLLQRVSDRVVSAGLKQLYVQGATLWWHSGVSNMINELETRISACTEHPQNILDQFRRVMRLRVAQEAHTYVSTKALPDMVQAERTLVPSRFGVRKNPWGYIDVDPRDDHSYKVVGREWRQVYEHLVDAQNAITALMRRAVLEGRVMCCEETDRGDRLVPPAQVPIREEDAHPGSFSYLFSADLPGEWFDDAATLPNRRKQAIAWINRAGAHFTSQGRRPVKADLMAVAETRFGLTKHAVEELWSQCAFAGKGQRGSVPKSQRVSLTEIKAID